MGAAKFTAHGSGGGVVLGGGGGGGGASVVVTAVVVGCGVLATVESPELQPAVSTAAAAATPSLTHTPPDGTALCERRRVTARAGSRLQIR